MPAPSLTKLLIAAGAATALTLALASAQTPDAEGEAQALAESVIDPSLDPSKRSEQLKALRRVDHAKYIEALRILSQSKDPEVAVAAVEQLVGIVVMMAPHFLSESHRHDQQGHDMSYVPVVLEILRDQFDNDVEPARHAALLYLSSIEDPETLERIGRAVSDGSMPAEEALPYLIAGQGDQTIELLRQFATSETPGVADSAIAYLGTDSTQQSYVRENILGDETVPPDMRGVALDTLSKYDDNFLTYATQPDIVEFALTFDGSADVARSGVEILNDALNTEIRQNPERKDFYKSVLDQAARNFTTTGNAEAGRILDQQIIRNFD
jgi:hypothetical protein